LSVEEYLRQQLYNHAESIDLRGYMITLSELSSILSSNKDFIVASGSIKYGYYDIPVNSVNDRIVAFYNPYYLFDTIEQDEIARRLIDEGVKKYVDEIEPQTDDLLGRLLLLHDKLIEDCEYDADTKIESFSLYSVFAKKEMVCQGYAQAMYFIGRELGLEMEFCMSYEIGHIWNYVKIDNEYYHIDATWDDPVLYREESKLDENGDEVLDENGNPVMELKRVHRTTANHNNFLKSDQTMQMSGSDHGQRNGWRTSAESVPVCNSIRYEKNHFFNIPTAFTTNLNGENYEAIVNIQTYSGIFSDKVFYADGLYTGPIITSYPEDESNYYFIYCLLIENTNKFNVFVKAHNLEKVVDVVRYKKIPLNLEGEEIYYSQNSITGQRILKSDLPEGKNQISVYMWDMETMEPLSRVIHMSR
ncbi:MAG: hypothetical protein IKK18_04430, partial [Clostridia bacterium]|nr:hypothetical protein [Clostridia bacterium]